jgi:hypothetical protein
MDPEGNKIEEKCHLRDLGVEMANDLTFNIHIEIVVAAATKLVGLGMRTFRSRSTNLMLTIWKSLVQSKLHYCSQLWSLSDQGSIARLESVAKNFTSQVRGHGGAGLLGELGGAQHVLPGTQKRKVPDNFYLESVPAAGKRIQSTFQAQPQARLPGGPSSCCWGMSSSNNKCS